MKNKKNTPRRHDITALYADEDGNIFDVPNLRGVGSNGAAIVPLKADDLILLPEGADVMFLPQRNAVGMTKAGVFLPVAGRAVAAILPPGYTRTFLPAFVRDDDAAMLPLYGYTAAVLYKDDIYAAAILTDSDAERWNPLSYNTKSLSKLIAQTKKRLPNNRLVEHLAHCSRQWHCTTAQNLFYGRFEAGVPTSPVCNANCLGCISLQAAQCCPSPQNRINFSPTVQEIADVGAYHLCEAFDPIISFGQGCEGEPSLNADNIVAAVRLIRQKTSRGIINMNTNAGNTANIKKIVDAGLNSMRVSIISARDDSYDAYYRAAYTLADVKASLKYALAKGVHISLNLLYMPGFTDDEREAGAWEEFFAACPVNMVQIRNLNIDPDYFFQMMPTVSGNARTTKTFLRQLGEKFPAIRVGSFTHSN